jgi:hypothetical protein
MKPLVLLSVVAMSFTACGDDKKVAATATAGDEFCTLAQVAADDNDALDEMDVTDAATVKLQLSAAIDSLNAASKKAPKDIAETVTALLADEERLEKLLRDNDFDIVKMSETDEGKEFIAEADESTDGDEFDTYLSDKCGIERPDSSSDDTTPVDDTIVTEDTTPVDDTIVTEVTVPSGVSVELGEGEDAINQFLDFYELGTGADLTDEQRSCIVDALAGKVTGDDLNEAIADTPSEELTQALGLAFIGCDVAVG